MSACLKTHSVEPVILHTSEFPYTTQNTMIKSLIILLVLKCAMCQRVCPVDNVVTSTDGTKRYEKVFNCMMNNVIYHGMGCSSTCCADKCQSSSNCNSFFSQYSSSGVPYCYYNNQGNFQYTSTWNCKPHITGYTRCILSCPARQESLSSMACTACRAGTYKTTSGTGVCIQCPEGAEAPGGPCFECNAGWTETTNNTCSECPAGKYKISIGNFTCTDCSIGKYSNTSAASSNETCLYCGAGKYSMATGLKSADDCTSCVAGKYCTVQGATSDVCQTCTSNSNSIEASDEQTDCTCNIGYTGGNGGPCEACIAGKYKVTTGDAACTSCVTGQYSTTVGAMSNACQTCVADSNSAEASDEQTDCTCNSGYTGGNGGPCVACVAGKYKVQNGDAACINCVAGQYSITVGATSDTCQTCVADSNSVEASDQQTDCICNSGYTTGDGGLCVACIAGKYKVQNGNVECTSCVTGQYSTAVGATSDACETCAADSNSLEASDEQTDCTCNSGYTGGDGGPCVACIAGKYKVQNGDAACTNCVAGQYSTTVGATSDTCQTCVADSNSVEASDQETDCMCNSGYTGSNGGPCVACIAGKYKVATGNAVCTNCDAAKYSAAVGATSNVCQACAINSYSASASDEQTDCTCNEGFSGANGDTCSLCAAGTYKKDIGDACHTCGSGSNSPAGSAVCTCNAGLAVAYDDTCVSCAAGKYRPGSFITNWARSCGANMQQACPTQQSSTQSAWGPAGSHLAVDGNNNGRFFSRSCTHTSGGQNWWRVDLGKAIRITGLHIFGRNDGEHARTNNFEIYIGNDTSNGGRFANNQVCVTNQNYVPPNSGARISCIQPIIGRDVYFNVPRSTSYSLCEVYVWSSDCSSCPPNSNSAPASDALVDCKCNPGSTGPDGQNCVLCSTGTYKTEPGSASCSPCPAGTYSDKVGSPFCVPCTDESNSPQGSNSVTRCTCNAGYTGLDGATCIPCEAGKYKIAVGSATCSSCDVGQYSTAIAATSNTCLSCPPNSNSPSASPLSQDCICNAGWSGSNGATCNQCAAGKYKIVAGDIACTNCVAGQYSVELGATSDVCQMCGANTGSAEASDEQTDCICNMGYTGANGGPCMECTSGKYWISNSVEDLQ